MAEPLTRKDLETVIQKVMITNGVTVENADAIAQPLIDEQKKNDIKLLKERIETKSVFVGIQNGISSVADSISIMVDKLGDWFKPKAQKGLGIIGIAAAILLAPLALLIGFGQGLTGQLKLLDKLFFKGKIFEKINGLFTRISTGFANLTSKIISFFRIEGKASRLFGWLKPIFSFLKGGFLKGFSPVFTVFKTLGRVLGKIFLPITVILSIIDGIKGFIRGYKTGGIIEGIKEAIVGIVDGLVGSILRGIGWVIDKIFDFFGLDNLGVAISEYFNQLAEFFNNTIRGLFDIVVGIFTFDGDTIMNGFKLITNAVNNLFTSLFNVIKEVGKAITDFDWFDDLKEMFNIGEKFRELFNRMNLWIAETFDWLPNWVVSTTDMKKEAEDELNQIEKDRAARQIENLERKKERETRKNKLKGLGETKTTNNNDNSTVINIFNSGNNSLGVLSKAFE